jgi:hypothetical protein
MKNHGRNFLLRQYVNVQGLGHFHPLLCGENGTYIMKPARQLRLGAIDAKDIREAFGFLRDSFAMDSGLRLTVIV